MCSLTVYQNNERWKMTSKRAHSSDEVPLAKRLRRSALSSAAEEQAKHIRELFTRMRDFVNEDGRHVSRPFFRFASKKFTPEHVKIVTNPMDLTLIHEKVKQDEYANVDQFMSDVNLMVENAKNFYKKDSVEYGDACDLWNMITEARNKQECNSDTMSEFSNRSMESSPTPSLSPKRESVNNRTQACLLEKLLCTVLTAKSEDGLLCEAFKVIPSKEEWPYYYEVIRDPIDLRTISMKLRRGRYRSVNDLEKDLNQLCRNAKLFNEPSSSVYRAANAIRKLVAHRKMELTDSNTKSSSYCHEMKKATAVIDNFLREVCAVVEEDSDDEQIPLSTNTQLKNLYTFLRGCRDEVSGQCLVEPFLRCPDRSSFPKYYEKIAMPISFYAINHKLKVGLYNAVSGMLDDISLLCSNVKVYFGENSELYKRALKLQLLAFSKIQDTDTSQLELSDLEHLAGLDDVPKAESSLHLPAVKLEFNEESGRGKVGRKSFDDALAQYREKLLSVYNAVVNYRDQTGRVVAMAFMEKPSKKLYPDYYKVIPEPIDLHMIKATIDSDRYTSSQALAADFELLFENARHYNEDYSAIYTDANTLNGVFADAMKHVFPTPLTIPRCSKARRSNYNFILKDRSRRGSYSSDSSGNRVSRKSQNISLGEHELKLWYIYQAIKEFRDPNNRTLSSVFLKLPSRTDYPDYYEVIRKPIDLQKICNKLSAKQYDSVEALVSDFALMFDNACKFNDPDSLIYKDALTLQRVLIQKAAELRRGEQHSPPIDVQSDVQELLNRIFSDVLNYQDDLGRCLSDSLYEADEEYLMKTKDKNAVTLNIIKKRLEMKWYKRLDRFQQDMLEVFKRARRLKSVNSQIFEDSVDLQSYFIKVRDELTKRGDLFYSSAMRFTEKDLISEIDAMRRRNASKSNLESEVEDNSINEPQVRLGSLINAVDIQHSEAGLSFAVKKGRVVMKSCCEGDVELSSVDVDGIVYNVGHFAYVKHQQNNYKPRILLILRIWKQSTGAIGIFGNWYYRPSETCHVSVRKFLKNEVFRTDDYDRVEPSALAGRCHVLFIKTFVNHKPTNFADEDVYVCESRYSIVSQEFKKIKSWQLSSQGVHLEDRSTPCLLLRMPLNLEPHDSNNGNVLSSAQQGENTNKQDDNNSSCLLNDTGRTDVVVGGQKENSSTVAYEQIQLNGCWIRLGDCVYIRVAEHEVKVVLVERIWKSQGDILLHGIPFVSPHQIEHEPTQMFYKKELFAVEPSETFNGRSVIGRCAVLSLKDYCSSRPTEVNEADVFLCDSRAVWNEYGKRVIPDNPERKFKIPTFRLSCEVPEDEVVFFKKPMNAEKEPSPFLMRRAIVYNEFFLPEQKNDNSRCSNSEIAEPSSSTTATITTTATTVRVDTPSTPKLTSRSKSGYILFSAVIRKRIMAENPECSFGHISKIVGAEWKKLSEEEKKKYEEEAQKIAEEREKADQLTGGRLQLLPGQIRVYCCKWRDCDYQFDTVEQLNEHITSMHTSQIVEGSDNQYVCMWLTCSKYRKEGRPFPSLARLHRHIKEKHMPQSAKCLFPQNLGKHYIPISSLSSGLDSAQLAQTSMSAFQQQQQQTEQHQYYQQQHYLEQQQQNAVLMSTSTSAHQFSNLNQTQPIRYAPPGSSINAHSAHVAYDCSSNHQAGGAYPMHYSGQPLSPAVQQTMASSSQGGRVRSPASFSMPATPTKSSVDPGSILVRALEKPVEPIQLQPQVLRVSKVVHSKTYLNWARNRSGRSSTLSGDNSALMKKARKIDTLETIAMDSKKTDAVVQALNLMTKALYCRVDSKMVSMTSSICVQIGDIIDNWKLTKLLGFGTYGFVYEVLNLKNDQLEAMKLEDQSSEPNVRSLNIEILVLRSLNKHNARHCCQLLGSGRKDKFNYMVITLVGKTFEDILQVMKEKQGGNGKLDSCSAMYLCMQALEGLQDLHAICFIHRDVKPQNFAIGVHPNLRSVYMLDFGTVRKYLRSDGKHRRPRAKAGFRGTFNFASVYALNLDDQSRRDDMWSWMYLLIQMTTGTLPWLDLPPAGNYFSELEQYKAMKTEHMENPAVLLNGCPEEYHAIFNIIKQMTYYSAPEYDGIYELLKFSMKKENLSSEDAPLQYEQMLNEEIANNK
ncbi:Protein polybromo-1 [Trichinella pseudospiralis]|uniref:Protein polybromo-1 n=1 Tax=Trichinella pseudospiralis TaxID=6337 RepID=A0A0V1K7P9_TRIPS|nr:Protein polybromo-1 [Trichinella pseudospiralis]